MTAINAFSKPIMRVIEKYTVETPRQLSKPDCYDSNINDTNKITLFFLDNNPVLIYIDFKLI